MKRLILDRLNAAQIRNINLLLENCKAKEPTRLSIPLAGPGTVLTDERYLVCYEQGQLVSLIHLFYPDHLVGELIGFTHPDFRGRHYFDRLLSLAADYAEEIGLKQVYVISDGNSADAKKALEALGLDTEYSEYMLGKQLEQSASCSISQDPHNHHLSVSEVDHTPLTAELFSRIFDTHLDQCKAYMKDICSDQRIHNYVLSLNGCPIGQTQLTFMEDMAYISGFGILPEYRRQGFGLAFLHDLEQILTARSITQLTLQVSSQNKNALSLYRKDGFDVLEQLNYHPLFEEI